MQTTPLALTATPTPMKRKVESLLALDKITLQDLEGFDNSERARLANTATKMLGRLKGAERDTFLNKIELIIPAETKNRLWEHNQWLISAAITNYMQQHGVMPAKSIIAAETRLSRQTVAKHFKDYKTHPDHLAEIEQFKFMTPRVLSNVFKFALNGDMRAARLYFEMAGTLKQQANTVVNEQNNYIQINNTILSQENLKHLTAEQLNQIENIVKMDEMEKIGLNKNW